MGTRRKFSSEFKREAVALTAQSDVSVAQVARELGIAPNLPSQWRRALHAEGACSRLSIPRATASRKLTEQRCPVTLIPRR